MSPFTRKLRSIALSGVILSGLAGGVQAQVVPPGGSAGLGNSSFFGTSSVAEINPIYALAGRDYAYVDYGSAHRSGGIPHTLQGWGIYANEAAGSDYDTFLSFDRVSGSSSGFDLKVQKIDFGLRPYRPTKWGKLLLEGSAGLEFLNGSAATTKQAFSYSIGVGAEWESTNLALMPYVEYQSAPKVHEYNLNAGIRAGFRLMGQFGAVLVAQTDRHANLTFKAGLALHY